ncbi:uncharacterized protein LOC126907911 isoform X2 [Daktulosphaira vitifoliae]|uniref:uncharacterized protein LOC126907911 isoform X2 n=1 Tax=Daktulosphaira vitifoliae TaxID=58002 RepID=UPI0021AA0D8F|nr:uncharacterized protein LOC126907911 isoform X2 [Daktulosphaira vitifoliae]
MNDSSKISMRYLPRQKYPSSSLELSSFPDSTHGHDFNQGHSRVVMTRKTERRIYVAPTKSGQVPKIETLTKETVQTFRGNKTERKITSETKNIENTINSKLDGSIDDFLPSLSSRSSRSSTSSPELKTSFYKQKCATLGKYQKKILIDTNTFVQECLDAHNYYRKKHLAPSMSLSKKLCKYAEEWAKYLSIKGVLDHRPSSPYGENLFCCWTSLPTYRVDGKEPVDSWYEEIKFHPFGREPTTLKSGHFTQVIWMSSKEVGVGVASGRSGQVFVVACYDPPGNFLGQFRENVPPPGGFKNEQHISKILQPVYTDEQLYNDSLKFHNEYRSKHGSGPLKLNKMLCRNALSWAMTLAKEDKFMHQPDNPFGENLFSIWSSNQATAKDAVINWYKEGKNYDYTREPRILKSGHFTQLVWKGSKSMGIAMVKGKSGRIVIVANYDPPGNIMGQFTANVLKPI